MPGAPGRAWPLALTLAEALVARSQKVCQKTWRRDWRKARELVWMAAMLASMSAWFLTRKGWKYVVKTQVEPWEGEGTRGARGSQFRAARARRRNEGGVGVWLAHLRLREGEEEEEDGPGLPVEGDPGGDVVACVGIAAGGLGKWAIATHQSRIQPVTYSKATNAPTTAQYMHHRSRSGSETGRCARAFHVA